MRNYLFTQQIGKVYYWSAHFFLYDANKYYILQETKDSGRYN